ncbi:MAG: Rpn family recombination-promoting nuclease/putative transposase [Oscillospiraceae bacterium]|jgi:hypothetical protein|nr:Rpn family recombination-promoting nuclease/putative transposase [Oscillospiraceae bacterium]
MAEMYCRLFYDTEDKIREQKEFRLPAVVPIVLYNGADEWNCVRTFKEYLTEYEMFVPNVIDFEYLMFNVNAPDEDALTNTPTLMNLAMLLDRKGDKESFLRRMKTVRKMSRKLAPDEQTQLKDWIIDVILKKVRGAVGREAVEKIRKSFDEGDENEMTYAIERIIDDAVRQGEAQVEERVKLETARTMIKDGVSIEKASKYLGIPADELRRRFKASNTQPSP